MNRRTFLKIPLVAAAYSTVGSFGILFPDEAVAIGNNSTEHPFWMRDRHIEIVRADTKERASIKFFENGRYIKEGFKHACYLFRDAKDNNTVANMDVQLFNLIYGVQEWARMAGKPNPIITLNSGYRTPRRNARIEGAALNSMHIHGKAADIVMRGVEPWQLAEMAKRFHGGGVGTYRGFTHVDTGRMREWLG